MAEPKEHTGGAAAGAGRWRLPGPLRQLFAQAAQIYLQPSAAVGLVIVGSLAAVRPWAAVGLLWASVVALAVTRVARLDRGAGEAGLLGFNAALIGAGMLSLFAPGPGVFGYLTLVAAGTTLISAGWGRWLPGPPLTIQFVAAMWGALGLGARLGEPIAAGGCEEGIAGVACGIGQVTFVAGALPGLCVGLAVLGWAPAAGLWLWLGAGLGLATAGLVAAPGQAIGLAVNLGLTALALTVLGRGVAARAVGLGLAAGLCLLCGYLRAPYFTLPFNLATWAVLAATVGTRRG